MKQYLYKLRNWLIDRYLRLRHRRIIPVHAMPTDWAAEDLIRAVALNVLKVNTWSIRHDGLSFEIPADSCHEHFRNAYTSLHTRYHKLYPLIRARLQQIFRVPRSSSDAVAEGKFILAHREHTVQATFRADRIDFRVTDIKSFDMNKLHEEPKLCTSIPEWPRPFRKL